MQSILYVSLIVSGGWLHVILVDALDEIATLDEMGDCMKDVAKGLDGMTTSH